MKRRILISATACFLLLFCLEQVDAQLIPNLGGQRVGTAAVQFLKIGVGARAVAMGESFVAVANDASALYWNPAGIVEFQQNSLFLSHINWLVDIQHDFVGYVHHIDATNSVGVSFNALYTDDMQETTEYQPFGTGNYFSFGDIGIGLTYGRKMTDRFSFGLTLKYFRETLAEFHMQGFMIDLGTFYWTGFGSSRFAVCVSNFGNQVKPTGNYTNRDRMDIADFQSFSPPTVFKVGFATELYQTAMHRITTAVQLNHPNDNAENLNLGVEYALREYFFLRSGYKLNVDEETFSMGVGCKVPLKIIDLAVDFAYSDFGRLGNVTRFSILMSY
jgi:hypothetical protein